LIDLVFSLIGEYILFNAGKAFLLLISAGRVKATYDDKPFSSLVVSIIGLIVLIGLVLTAIYIIGEIHA
jgi:hypothetical protein